MFRVRIWNTCGNCVRAYTQPLGLVEATAFCTFMRGRGHQADLIESTRSLTTYVDGLAKRYPATLVLASNVQVGNPGHAAIVSQDAGPAGGSCTDGQGRQGPGGCHGK